MYNKLNLINKDGFQGFIRKKFVIGNFINKTNLVI